VFYLTLYSLGLRHSHATHLPALRGFITQRPATEGSEVERRLGPHLRPHRHFGGSPLNQQTTKTVHPCHAVRMPQPQP